MDSLRGVLTSFFLICVLIVNYWYISLPLFIISVIVYLKTKRAWLRKLLRIFFAFIILAAIAGIVVILAEDGAMW